VFQLLADAVVLVHFLFIAFILFGGLLALRRPRFALLHLPIAVWGVLVQWMSWICPLTPLENLLRARSGRAEYTGGFIEHYLLPILYPAALGPRLHTILGLAVLVANTIIYAAIVLRLRARRQRRNAW
jgi:hypothetical protein